MTTVATVTTTTNPQTIMSASTMNFAMRTTTTTDYNESMVYDERRRWVFDELSVHSHTLTYNTLLATRQADGQETGQAWQMHTSAGDRHASWRASITNGNTGACGVLLGPESGAGRCMDGATRRPAWGRGHRLPALDMSVNPIPIQCTRLRQLGKSLENWVGHAARRQQLQLVRRRQRRRLYNADEDDGVDDGHDDCIWRDTTTAAMWSSCAYGMG